MKVLLATVALLVTPIQTVSLPRATGIASSADARMVVARSGVGSLGTLTVFRRERSGRLTRLQCVTRHAKACLDGRGLETPSALAIPRDGTNLYVTAANGRSLGIYRTARGKLSFAGSVAGLSHPLAVVVSPAGDTVYVGGDKIWAFERMRGGGLVLDGTIDAPARALAVGEATLYAASAGKLTAYARADLTETSSVASPLLRQPNELALAHGTLYAVSLGNVSRWTPALDPLGSKGGLPRAFGLAVAANRIYVAYRDGVAILPPSLQTLRTIPLPNATAVAAGGRQAYVVADGRITVLEP
jgi:DNA-binding beta-propeller fold protein YncE